MSKQDRALYEFGRYRLIPAERLLLRDGEPVALTPKAFELLVVLVRRAGKLVDKEDLLREVWPDTSVEESNIAQNVFSLRRALGDDLEYIETVPKRGYRFVPNVTTADPAMSALSAPAVESSPLPASPPPAPVAGTAFRRRARDRKAIAVVVFIAVSSIVGFYLTWKNARDARTAAPRALTLTRLLSGTHIPSAVISPDGRYVAHVVENGDRSSILVRQVSTITDLVIVPPEPGAWYIGLCFSRDGDSLYFVKYVVSRGTTLYRVSALGGIPVKVIDRVGSQIAFSPDGKRIAFVREGIQKESALMIANADGTGERVLARRQLPHSWYSSGHRGGPSWSPDGKTIATGVISIEGGYHGQVVTVSVSDGRERPLTSHRWYQVAQTAWLPDGNSLLVTAKESTTAQIWEVAYPSGTARRIFTDLADYHGVTITADGSVLATVQYDLRSTISFVPEQPAGARKRNTEGMHEGFYGISYTPTGEVVYASDASGNHDLWLASPDHVTTRQLTNDPAHDSTPSVSPDGRSVVFMSRRGSGNQHIWRMDIDGRNPVQLTNHSAEGTPSFTPDAKWVVYADAGTGIWKMPAEGGKPVSIATGYIHTPSVSPDGSRVVCFYQGPKSGGTNQLAIVPLTPGSPMQVLNIPEGFSGATIRWTPDSRALIHVRTQGEVGNLWTLPLDGSAPRQLTSFTSDHLFNFAFSRDQKELAVARGSITEHVVLIRDFR